MGKVDLMKRNRIEQMKKYRLKNKKKIAEYNKKYRLENKIKIKKDNKKYCLENKEVISKKLKEYRLKNKEKIAEYMKEYRIKNRNRKREYLKDYRLKNPYYAKSKKLIEKQKNNAKAYYLKNKIIIGKKAKDYYLKNKNSIRKKANEYVKNRYKTDEDFVLRRRLRGLIRNAFKCYSTTGKIMTSRKYGINFGEIIKHLGSCPGDRKEYHIDHIIPLSSFDFDDFEQINKAFAPENHQWLLAKDNLRKSNKMQDLMLIPNSMRQI